jgi:HK97 family phage portal protein
MFVSRIRANADDRSPWGDFWFTPLGSRGAAGAQVSPDSALRLAAVYACVRVLTESFAVLPFRLYRVQRDGSRKAVTDHWLARLMSRMPNRWQTPFEFKELVLGHLALRGNAYCQIVEDGAGGIAELVPMHPDRMKIDMLDSGSWRYGYNLPSGQVQWFRRDEIWHLRGLSSDGILGMSPIALAREAVSAGLAAQDYAARFFANDAKPTGGWIGTPDNVNFADKGVREQYRQSVQEAMTGVNRHKMLVLDKGMKYNQVGTTNKDSQFLEAREFNRAEIAGIFLVPPHMIGDLSHATFSNIEQQAMEFWQRTMLPWTQRVRDSVFTQLTQEDSLVGDFDFRHLMRGDSVARSQYLHNMVLDGILVRNEAREIEGYDPIDGLDEPLVPANEMTLAESNEPDDPVTPPGVGSPAKEEPAEQAAGSSQATRLAQLLRGNAQRLARRVARGDAPSVDVLSKALAVPGDHARAWLELDKSGRTEDELAASLIQLGEPA